MSVWFIIVPDLPSDWENVVVVVAVVVAIVPFRRD